MNIVPRSGGNSFSGTAFVSTANDWSKGRLNDELRAVGIDEAPGIIQAHDASMSWGPSFATVSGSSAVIATSTRRPRWKA